jgi:hypothetical protein
MAVALTCRHLLVWLGGKRKRKSCEANAALEGHSLIIGGVAAPQGFFETGHLLAKRVKSSF